MKTPTLDNRLLATFDQRLSAILLDLIPILILYGIINLLLSVTNRIIGPIPSLPLIAELLLELYLPALAYNLLLPRLFSATVGKRLLGISVMRTNDSRPRFARIFLRELLKLSPLLLISAFMILARQDNRGLHDLLAGTVVVHDTPGIPASRIE